MKNRIRIFIFFTLFFLIFFAIARLIFIIVNFPDEFVLSEILLSFVYGAHQDASAAGYLLVIPALFFIFSPFFPGKSLSKIFEFYFIIIIVLVSLLVVFDAVLYSHWGFRMDTTPLLYITKPKEAAASANFLTFIKIIFLSGLLIFISIRAYIKFVKHETEKLETASFKSSAVFVFILISLIIPVRGSLGIAPMNIGMVYFSEKNVFANHSAVNLVWNIGYSVVNIDNNQKLDFFDKQTAEKYFNELYLNSDSSSIDVFNIQKPNVVIIILESFTSKAVGFAGGMEGITPNLDKLAAEGVFFNNFYASGDRTDKGIVAILSAYPAQPTTSIIKFTAKTEKLPTLTSSFKANGYNTSWICGFDINFANFKSYLIHNSFGEIITVDDFDKAYRNSKWGIHDHIVFDKLYDDCINSEYPFFKVFMSLSSHEPFDVPMETVIEGNTDEQKFLNSMYYTDRALGNFFEKIKSSSCYENTVFIIVADHGARNPGNSKMYLPEKFQIPMVWVGGALAIKDTVIEKFASQTDISKTLKCALNFENISNNLFSKNIFAKNSKSFAFYDFNNGFGFLSDSTACVYDIYSNKYIISDSIENYYGKAYIQSLLNDYSGK